MGSENIGNAIGLLGIFGPVGLTAVGIVCYAILLIKEHLAYQEYLVFPLLQVFPYRSLERNSHSSCLRRVPAAIMKVFWAIVCLVVYVHADSSVSAVANSDLHHDSRDNSNPETNGMTPDMIQELVWFFRRDDPSSWNYCILGLSVAVLLIGLILLGVNIKANRHRHALLLNPPKGDGSTQTDEAELKQVSLPLQEGGDLGTAEESLLPKVQNAGQVVIQWKDGNITTLFAEAPEEDV